jgi:hypothetical protein
MVRLPNTVSKEGAIGQRLQNGAECTGGIFHADTAASIQLHLAVTNETGERSVPVRKESSRTEDRAP